jgi:hypothetical protein
LGRLLLRTHVIVAAVLLCRSAVNLGGLLVMLGRLLMHFLRHFFVLSDWMGKRKASVRQSKTSGAPNGSALNSSKRGK